MRYNENDLEEITRMFIKLADKLLADKRIDKNTYIEITKRKKGFLKFVEKDRIYNRYF
ncbi:hypothetical protein [Senegalia massiliensis]|uniref:hypothetical protein n=1 Tax=Senegalia massiliensis TaxID=1720316 RepID=UPI0013642B4A|nr:hypothetical protein [Senegalia massiliensis]